MFALWPQNKQIVNLRIEIMKQTKMRLVVALGVMLLLGGAVVIPQMRSSETLFTKNVEAISSGESFWNTWLWYKVWTDCTVHKVEWITVSSGELKYDLNTVKYGNVNYSGTPYKNVTTQEYSEPGRKSYCYDGRQLCASDDCR